MSFRSAVSLIEKVSSWFGLVPVHFDRHSHRYVASSASKLRFFLRAVLFNAAMVILSVVSFDMKTIESNSIVILHFARLSIRAGWVFYDLIHFVSLILENNVLIASMNRILGIMNCYVGRRILRSQYKIIKCHNQILLTALFFYFGPFLFTLYTNAFGLRLDAPLLMNLVIFNAHVAFLTLDCSFFVTLIWTLSNVLIGMQELAPKLPNLKRSTVRRFIGCYTDLWDILEYMGDVSGKQLLPLNFMALTSFSTMLYFMFEYTHDPILRHNGFGSLLVYVFFVNLPIILVSYACKKMTDTINEVS